MPHSRKKSMQSMFQMDNQMMNIDDIDPDTANEEFDEIKVNHNAFGKFMKTFDYKPVKEEMMQVDEEEHH